MKVVKCKRCGREFEVEKATGFKYCKDCLIEIKKERQSRQNKSDFQKRQEKLLEGVEGVDYIIDLWNGYATKLINGKWMEVHHPGKTIEDYKKDFQMLNLFVLLQTRRFQIIQNLLRILLK